MANEIQVLNFVKTALRAPVGPTDTQLQLTTGTGVLFNPIVASNFVFITVNDSTTVEVMKYTSAGPVINDTIIVERAQDNTTAKSFPVGACVAIGWPVIQVTDLVDQEIINIFNTTTLPNNTMLVGSTPTGIPPVNVIYAVNPATGQLWFYNTATVSWVYINSNSVQLRTTAPTLPPPANIVWAINTSTSSLYFWSGLVWVSVGGGGGAGSSYLEVNSRQYFNNTGVPIAKGTDNAFGNLITGGLPVTTQCVFKSNPSLSNVIQVRGDNALLFLAPCIVELSADVTGDVGFVTDDFRGQITIYNSDLYEWQNQIYVIGSSGSATVAGTVSTGPYQVTTNTDFDVSITVLDGGSSYVGFQLKQMALRASVIALL